MIHRAFHAAQADLQSDWLDAITPEYQPPNPLQLAPVERWIADTDPKIQDWGMYMTKAPDTLDNQGTRELAQHETGWRAVLIHRDRVIAQRQAYGVFQHEMLRPYHWGQRLGLE